MDDSKITAAIFERRDEGLKELERKYGKRLRRICIGIVGSQDGEECLNDTLLAVWNTIPPARPENLFGFAAVIARRKAIDRLKSNAAGKRGGRADILLSELEDCLPSRETAEQKLNLDETSALITAWLNEQKPRERRMFILRYFGGEDIGYIANQLCMSPSAVRTALSRLRGRLKTRLEERGVEI